MPGLSRGLRAIVLTAAALAGVLTAGWLIWDPAGASFTAAVANSGNSWTAGEVTLTSETTSVLFSLTGLQPGQAGERCVVVTYNGDLDAAVKLYASATSGTLGQYLDLQIEVGSGGNYASCGGFVADHTAYPTDANVTLAYFGGNRTTFATGVGTWAPTGPGQTRVYRFSYVVDPATPDGAQGATAGVTFTWEAQNT